MSYLDACDAAATAQGLDPITTALADNGVVATVEQTGGFTMVLTVTADDGTYGVTRADDQADSDRLQVVFYPGSSFYDGEHEDEDLVIYPPLDLVTTTTLLYLAVSLRRPLTADDLERLGIDAGLRF